jgi:Dyp-type peroxidase family
VRREEGHADGATQPVSAASRLELEDIQGGVLHQLPLPYTGTVDLLTIDDRQAASTFLERVIPSLRSAADPTSPDAEAWLSIAFTFSGLQAVGVPEASLSSFAPEFRDGMAARALRLHDVGESAPERWEAPFGSPDVHVAVSAMAPDQDRLDALLRRADDAIAASQGVSRIYRQECRSSNGREAFGFRDNISQPAVEGTGMASSNSGEEPIKAGEFIFGYPNETGRIAPVPTPDLLGRNGTYLVLRKLQQRVAAFREYLRHNAGGAAEEELLAAKIMGRWRSGAPLVLNPERDDPELGADGGQNNDFGYGAEGDSRGFKCPLGAHIRRMNPRDGEIFGNPRTHRLIRREVSYGPPFPEGALTDDGIDRGMIFACIGASLRGQFEFVQEEWVNSGIFIGQNEERDPLCGANGGTGAFTIPERPIRRRLHAVPSFVVTRGGEYFFMPGLRALRWIAEIGA